MNRHLILFLTGLGLIAASLACGVTAAPVQPSDAGTEEPAPVFAPTQGLEAPTQPPPSAPTLSPISPAIPELRRVTLEFPPRIRLGDSNVIRLTLEVDDLEGMTATAQVPGNQVQDDMLEIPNLYESHNVIVEARLDMAGVEVRPSEIVSSPLSPGQPVTFYWSVRPGSAGIFKGTAWLFVRFIDKKTGQESQRAVSAQPVQIQSTDFFGLSASFTRITGAIGSVVGGILGLPFLDDLLKALYRRLKRR